MIEASVGIFPTAEIIAKLEAADVPCAPILSRPDLLSDPQVIANELIHELHQPGMGQIRQARAAAKFSSSPHTKILPAPGLGEHSVPILEDLGYNPKKISTLIANEVVIRP